MENPTTWGPAERVVKQALDWSRGESARGVVGLSTTRRITDALRQEGLLGTTGGPPAPGHRRLHDILADACKCDADVEALRAEFLASAGALFSMMRGPHPRPEPPPFGAGEYQVWRT